MNWRFFRLYPGDHLALLAGHVVVQATVLLAVVWLLAGLLRLRQPATRHCVDLATLLALAIIPLATWSADESRTTIVDLREPIRKSGLSSLISPEESRFAPPSAWKPAQSGMQRNGTPKQTSRASAAGGNSKAPPIDVLAAQNRSRGNRSAAGKPGDPDLGAGAAFQFVRLAYGLLLGVRLRRDLQPLGDGPIGESLCATCRELARTAIAGAGCQPQRLNASRPGTFAAGDSPSSPRVQPARPRGAAGDHSARGRACRPRRSCLRHVPAADGGVMVVSPVVPSSQPRYFANPRGDLRQFRGAVRRPAPLLANVAARRRAGGEAATGGLRGRTAPAAPEPVPCIAGLLDDHRSLAVQLGPAAVLLVVALLLFGITIVAAQSWSLPPKTK